MVPAFPALSETFVYREIVALQNRGATIGLCALYDGSGTDADTPDLDSLLILYKNGFFHLIGALLKYALQHPISTLKTFATLLADLARVGPLSRHAGALVYQFVAAFRLASHLKQHNYRHIHAHFAHSPTQVAMYAASLAGISFSFTGHANDIYERGILLKEKASRATQMVTISDFNKRHLLIQGVSSGKVSVVRAILTFPTRAPQERDNNQRLRIGSLGRLVGKKGMDTLLSSLTHLTDHELAKLTVEIGGGGPQRSELEALAETLRPRGVKIDFLGQIPSQNVSDWMQSLDAFVLACRQTNEGDVDGIPVVLMEAVAVGVPVISTSISGVTELIEPNVGGQIGQPDSAQDVANGIRAVMSEPDKVLALANSAQQRLRDEFDPDLNLDRLISVAFIKGKQNG